MALKNWKRKQLTDDYSIWLSKDFKKSIQIFKEVSGRYRVTIEGSEIKLERYFFNIRIKALKFVKSYMIKH